MQKTKKSLQDALIALIAEKEYESISVQEILDRANVGRSTFYTHFQYKDQLLHSCFEPLDEIFKRHNERLETASELRGDGHADLPLGIFRFAAEHHSFFKALLGKRGSGVFNRHVYDYLHKQIRMPIRKMLPVERFGPLRAEITAHYFVSAFMGVLVWWVENDMPCAAEEIDVLFKQLAMPGFMDVRSEAPDRAQR